MELFAKLFSSLLVFVYHCFDRIVIHGYLSGLSRPEQVVYFFRDVMGVPVVDKAVLSKRTGEYRGWVEAFARNHKIPMEWAQKGVRKEDYVRPWLRRMEQAGKFGVYFIFQSMEQGPTFRCSLPKFPTQDPNHRILAAQRSRFMHYYFYLRDETLGPMVMRVASFFPFQATYYLNGHSFIEQELNGNKIGFRKYDNAFLSVDDVAALQGAADRLTGKVIPQVGFDDGRTTAHPVFVALGRLMNIHFSAPFVRPSNHQRPAHLAPQSRRQQRARRGTVFVQTVRSHWEFDLTNAAFPRVSLFPFWFDCNPGGRIQAKVSV